MFTTSGTMKGYNLIKEKDNLNKDNSNLENSNPSNPENSKQENGDIVLMIVFFQDR